MLTLPRSGVVSGAHVLRGAATGQGPLWVRDTGVAELKFRSKCRAMGV